MLIACEVAKWPEFQFAAGGNSQRKAEEREIQTVVYLVSGEEKFGHR